VEPTAKQCEWCGKPVVITTFSSIRDWNAPQVSQYMKAYTQRLTDNPTPDVELGLGICLLKLGQYQKASEHIDSAISTNVDNPEAYLYAAVAVLDGKRPFVAPMANVRKALSYLDSAKIIENRGIFPYLSSVIRRDFFERKSLKVSPTADEELATAEAWQVSPADIDYIHELARIPRAG
jgi:tetratricopeptide (TPR) repeat protein